MNSFEILNGKALSYNNIKDLDIAWKVACEFEETACCALKHNTPCGVAVGENSKEVYLKAYDADPVSIFGGIVAINRKIDKATAEEMVKIFLEVVAAPDFDEDALEVLRTKKNLRVIKCKNTPSFTTTIALDFTYFTTFIPKIISLNSISVGSFSVTTLYSLASLLSSP